MYEVKPEPFTLLEADTVIVNIMRIRNGLDVFSREDICDYFTRNALPIMGMVQFKLYEIQKGIN